MVLDYTYNTSLSVQLLETYDQSFVLCMYVDCPPQATQTKISPETYAEQLGDYLRDFNWTKATLILQSHGYSREIGTRLMARNGLDLRDNIVIEQETDEEKMKLIVGRIVKPLGSKIGVFLVSKENAQRIVRQLEVFNLWKSGYAYLFAEEAGWGPGYDGLLYVTDSAASHASSREEFEAQILYSQLVALQQVASDAQYLNSQELLSQLQITYQGFPRPTSLALVNHNRQSKQLQSHAFLYPGNSSVAPQVCKSTLEVSVDNEGWNFDGTKFPSANIAMRGYMIGYEEVNRRDDVLQNYQIVPNSVSTGGSVFNQSWALQRMQAQRNKLGLAYYPYGGSATTIGIYHLLQTLNLSLPLSSMAIANELSNPEAYPLFFRTRANSRVSAVVMARFFSVFGWKRTALIHSDGKADMDFYSSFLAVAKQYSIEVINRERLIPLGFAAVQAEANRTLLSILQSSVRIIIIASSESFNITERLYDLGARAGDYLVCLFYGLDFTFYGGTDEASYKRRNVLKGGMMFYDRYFVGAEGAKVRKLLIAADGAYYEPVGCAMYDSVWLLLHALDFMLAKALPFESGLHLIEYIRKMRFVGCTGVVQLESGTNDRITGDYSIMNAQYDGETDTITLEDVATYSPTRVQMYNISSTLQFPDGSQMFSDSWPMHSHCPYYLREIREFSKGKNLGYMICVFFLSIATVVGVLGWLFWRNAPIQDLTERQTLTSEDALSLLSVSAEFCQLLSLAPALNSQPSFPLLRLVSMQWEDFVSFDHGVYWVLVLLACASVVLQVSYALWRVCDRCVEWCSRSCATSEYFVNLFGPVYMRLAYMPVVLTLASGFNCYRSTGSAYTDSYLNRDCYEKCWSGKHLSLCILSAVILLLHIPTVFFTQSLWEELQPSLHIRSWPGSLCLKLVTQTLLSLAYASTHDYSPAAHALIYTIVVSVYFLSILLVRPYNYERVNLWARILVLAALVYGVIGTINVWFGPMPWSEIAVIAAFLVLLVTGQLLQVVIKRYRSLLQRKVDDKSDIIKFAFTFGSVARAHLYRYMEKQKQSREVGSTETLNHTVVLSD